MKRISQIFLVLTLTIWNSLLFAGELDSWNESSNKQAIISYVRKVTTKGSSSFIPKPDRIAIFDNDGTLWSERPIPIQIHFALDRVKQLEPKHPEWKTEQPFAAVLQNDLTYLGKMSEREALKILAATHLGIPEDDFKKAVADWFKVAKDPKTGLLYTQRVYQPMLELMSFLRANDFKTYISTGGGTEFVREVAEDVYSIPPEQVIGSNIVTRFEIKDNKSIFWRELAIVEPINVEEGKPVNIQRIIGRIPAIAVGNSDGDLQMLQYTGTSKYSTLKLVVLHDDAAREDAYEEGAEKLLKEAKDKSWPIISMKKDFNKIYPTSPRGPAG